MYKRYLNLYYYSYSYIQLHKHEEGTKNLSSGFLASQSHHILKYASPKKTNRERGLSSIMRIISELLRHTRRTKMLILGFILQTPAYSPAVRIMFDFIKIFRFHHIV